MTLLTAWPSATNDDGSGQTGTIEDASFFNDMKSAIEALIHSTTNTTTPPKTTTDEVITARGSKSSLDARLDIALNEDGTPKSSAFTAYVATTALQSTLGARNLVSNGDLVGWSAGASAAPDNFTLSGTGAAVAQEALRFGTGPYGALMTFGSTALKLTQIVISAADFANYLQLRGKTIAFGAWGESSIASQLSVIINDGVTTTRGGTSGNATYHTGSDSPEWMYGTHVIANTATKIDIYVEMAVGGDVARAGGFSVMLSTVALSDFPLFSAVPVATPLLPGIVSIGAQSLAGVKTFEDPPLMVPGTAATTVTAVMGGVLSVNTTTVTPPDDTNENTLMSYSLPANVLSSNGKVVRVTAFLTRDTAGAGNITYKFKFGSTGETTAVTGTTAQVKQVVYHIVRTGSNTQVIFGGSIDLDVGAVAVSTASTDTATETDSGAITISFTATKATAGDDCTQAFMMVEVLN